MSGFEFSSVRRILFGCGQFAKVGAVAAEFGRTALVVHNSDMLIGRLAELLAASGVRIVMYRQRGEPTTTHVDEAIELAKEAICDLVIGLGGGSAIDAAKAVAGLLGNGGSSLDYMEVIGKGQKITKPAVPWIAIPTTAGTGAEVTRNAVIGSSERQFKASIRSEHLLARVAMIDPELAVGVPPDVTARCGMDALCQLIESYTSINANPMTDALALKGIPLAARAIRTAYQDGSNISARESMAMAAMLSGITLANAGLGAVHGLAAPLGANFPVPHGTVCGLLLPLVINANIAAMRAANHPRLGRYAEIGRLLVADQTLSDQAALSQCVDFTADLVRDLQLPKLSTFGFTATAIPEMIALTKKSSSMRYNPVVLSDDVLSDILKQAG